MLDPATPDDTAPEWFDNEHPSLRRCWHPVGWLRELDGPGPHPVQLVGEHHALFRTDDGWAMLPDRCPHRLAPLTAGTVVDGTIRCGYHGWRFAGDGRCVAIPAIGDAPIPPSAHQQAAAAIEERHGLVWVSLEPPTTPIPELPGADDPSFGRIELAPQTWHAGAAQMADNFLDVAHFPFTHAGTIGDVDDQLVDDYEVHRDGWAFHAVHRHSAQAMDDTGHAVGRTMTFECTAPHHITLRLEYEGGPVVVLTFFHQPLDVATTRLFTVELSTDLAGDPSLAADAEAFQLRVAEEDRVLLERLRTKGVPLKPGVETSTRADRITVELRRILRDLARSVPG